MDEQKKILEDDLVSQRSSVIPWWKSDFGKEAISNIEQLLLSHRITQGPVTESLESKLAELLDVPYVVVTTSGSTALLMALAVCGVKHGDEVILPALTWITTAQAPSLLGATIKLVDVEPRIPVISVENLAKAITPKAKVIIPVHLNGRSADMDQINQIAAEHKLRVIEDASQALCSRNGKGYLGLQSDIGVYSLGVTKLLTCGTGGFAITRNRKIYEQLIKFRNLGKSSNASSYDINGFNFKYNDILASIGLSQVGKIKARITALKNAYDFYKKELKDLDYMDILEVDTARGELPLWVEAMCPVRDKLIRCLRKENIEARPFDPCVSDSLNFESSDTYPNAENFSKNGLILPCGPDQTMDNLRRVTGALRQMQKQLTISAS